MKRFFPGTKKLGSRAKWSAGRNGRKAIKLKSKRKP